MLRPIPYRLRRTAGAERPASRRDAGQAAKGGAAAEARLRLATDRRSA